MAGMTMLNRRTFLTSGAALTLVGPRFVLGNTRVGTARDPKLVLVVLRGGMDGLAAIAPVGDKHYRSARGGLAMTERDLLPLDAFFAAHPALATFHAEFTQGRALAVHAVASPYRDRSHFDGQNVLEIGLTRPFESDQGWLNRASPALGGGQRVMAIGQSVPLVLRGDHRVQSWAPAVLPDPDDDTLSRLMQLYDGDDLLGPILTGAFATDSMSGAGQAQRGDSLDLLIDAATRFLTHPEGPRVAVIESSGWDTHANQGLERGALAFRLGALDRGFKRLRDSLGEAWTDTVVLCVTEFGRTVKTNGTRGTDHGTASAALLLGGALDGGRVISDWPGLKRTDLYEGRDLAPTTDMRSLYRAVLGEHFGVSGATLAAIFPTTDPAADPKLIG